MMCELLNRYAVHNNSDLMAVLKETKLPVFVFNVN